MSSLSAPEASVRPGPYMALGCVLIVLLFGAFGAWMAQASLDGAVVAPGFVTVESNRKTVQHLEGGIVGALPVRDGDAVGQGDLLVRLDGTRAKAQLAIVQGQLDMLKVRRARLISERDGAEALELPAALMDRLEASAVIDAVVGEEALFKARRAALSGETGILEQQARQLRQEIAGLDAQRRSKARQIEIIEEELIGLRELYAKGYAPRTRILALERTAEALAGERGEHAAGIARARQRIGEAELQVVQLEKDFQERVASELREVEPQIFDLEERRIAALDELERLEVRAPRAGLVVNMAVHTLGAVVGPGAPLMEIVPRDDELLIEAQVRPQDIDKVVPGQPAMVRLSAFSLRTTPELTAQVVSASADRMLEEATRQPYYKVRVRIPAEELARLGGLALVPGMPAEVFINTGARTALSYLMKPITDHLARAFREE